MTSRVSAVRRKTLMEQAVRTLAPYYGVNTSTDLINSLNLTNTSRQGNTQTSAIRTENSPTLTAEQFIMSTILDDAVGTNGIKQVGEKINAQLGTNPELKKQYDDAIDIYFEPGTDSAATNAAFQPTGIIDICKWTPNFINANQGNNPGKESPSVSAFLINTGRISFTQRNNNIVTLFLNSLPNIEINRIQPFLEINFNTPRTPITSSPNERINGMSLIKFLLGAEQVREDSVTKRLVLANTSTRPTTGGGSTNATSQGNDGYTMAGMEMFTSPQSLVNANALNNPGLHSQPILDKFQPFMSIEGVSLTVVPTHGLMSNKTGTIKMKLHDRSRLADIAEFIRPEYYGANEIVLQYGWYHPEGDSSFSLNVNARNPYGDLLNGMRLIEKYQIINSSYQMTDNGEITIELRISMKGNNDFESESILSSDGTIANSMRNIQEIQQTIASLRASVFGENNAGLGSREIRGTQILDAAGDGVHNLILTKELRTALTQMRASLNRGNQTTERGRNIEGLRTALDSFEHEVQGVQHTLAETMKRKIDNLSGGTDPMKVSAFAKLGIIAGNTTLDDRISFPGTQNAQFNEFLTAMGLLTPATRGNGPATTIRPEITTPGTRRGSRPVVNAGCFSLAKLLLMFVADPLASTKKFDEVQLFFYPFNINAAGANRINTGEFIINADLFMLKFMSWRLGNLGQSTNVNIREFLQWLAATFFDDPASEVYGLKTSDGSLYRTIFSADNGIGVEPNIASRGNADVLNATFMENLNTVLEQLTPNGEFRVPQIEFYMETLPGKSDGGVLDESKSIVKIHVFDRLNTPFESLQQIHRSTRDSSISSIGRAISQNRAASTPAPAATGRQTTQTRQEAARAETTRANTLINSEKDYNNFLAEAVRQEIIEQVSTGEANVRYRLAGGPNSARKLKEFFYKNCPYFIFGSAGSVVKNANLSSMQNSRLTTVNLLRSNTASPLEPNGENPGGLPMQIIPASLELSMLGCPYFNVGQTLFCDFGTGTTVDNFYSVVNVSHNIGPGVFETSVGLSPTDGYGQYINILSQINNFAEELDERATAEAATAATALTTKQTAFAAAEARRPRHRPNRQQQHNP